MLMRLASTYLSIAIFVFLSIHPTTSTSKTRNVALFLHPFRLPTTVKPIKYYLHINTRIHEDVLDYSGNVTIDIAVREPTDQIVLHAKLLENFVISLSDLSDNRRYENLDYSLDNATDFLRIFSPIEPLNLQVDKHYRLGILFTGFVRTKHFGYYRTAYKDEYNNIIPVGTTQFEPTSARLAFPCFDEPSFKSKFIITITHGSNYSAISNMPSAGEPILSSDGTMLTTTFRETPVMPTYLIAFVISNYQHISEFANGVEHRVFFPPNFRDNGHRALKNAIKSLAALEDYLGIKYPLPKLDHIRVNNTYGSAMENWGLIIYNKKNFLPTPENDDKHATLKLIIVQNHEIAHQWFGNLVSPKWWTYAWLNEGFATYFSYIATELVYPDWKVAEFFIDTEVEVTYNWPINHAMTHYVEREVDIKSVFDVVTYQKAACFVKMFHHAIGHKTFIKGIAIFLTQFQYSVADEDDLFKSLQAAIDIDELQLFQGERAIANVMHTWTHNRGIPVITVTRNYDEGTVTLHQRSNTKDVDETWWIPLNFATASIPNFERTTADYIMPPQHEITIRLEDIGINITNTDWLLVNKQQTGLQLVIYDDQNLQLIAETLTTNHQKIHMLNRAVLFRDIAAHTERESSTIEPLFNIIQYLKHERELMPWNSAGDLILDLASNLQGSEAYQLFKAFMRDIVAPIFHRVHKYSRSELEATELFSRAKIVDIACQMDLPECLNFTKHLTHEYFFHDVQIDDALRDISLCQGIKYYTFEEFAKLVERLISSVPNSERFDDIIYSVRCVESPENLKYFLQIIFEENSTYNIMSESESMQFLTFIYVSNYVLRPILLEYIRDNYKVLCRKANMVTTTLDRIAKYVPEDNGQREEFIGLLHQVDTFLERSTPIDEHKIGSRVRKREHFRKRHEKNALDWLTAYGKERTARNGSNPRPALVAARYIVAAGFISNLISLV